MGNVFGKASRILGLGEKEGRWVVEQDFNGNFQVDVTCFLPISPTPMTELCSFWNGLKDVFTLHKSADRVSVKTERQEGRGSARSVTGGSGANGLRLVADLPTPNKGKSGVL